MSDMPTSPEHTSDNAPALAFTGAPTIRAEWSRVATFLKRPSLTPHERKGPAIGMILRIYALDMCAMIGLILIATAVVAMGVELPETALAGIEITPLIALAVIIIAPVMEEVFFRGWLSGRPAHILALLVATLGIGLFVALTPATEAEEAGLSGLIGFGVALIAFGIAATLLVMLRNREPIAWFSRGFPLFFWLSTLAFALIHLGNFDPEEAGGSLAMLLPLVIPQFVLGALLGYLRVKIGLWAAIVLHAMHNATALGIAVLAMASGEAV